LSCHQAADNSAIQLGCELVVKIYNWMCAVTIKGHARRPKLAIPEGNQLAISNVTEIISTAGPNRLGWEEYFGSQHA
jgi:hypothetical protein